MTEFQGLEKALNQGGYIFIQLRDGDIYLRDASNKLDFPDFDTMKPHEKDQYEFVFEFIFDRKDYEENLGKGMFTKSLKLSSIRAVQAFKNVNI